MAGYSSRTSIHNIEHTRKYAVINATIDQQRDLLTKTAGTMLVDLVDKLQQIYSRDKTLAKDVDISASDMIRAIKETKELLGYKAPEQVEVKQQGLFLHLAGYSTEQLQAAYSQLTGEKAA